MTTRHFWAQNDPFALKKFFFRKTIDIILMYLLAFLIVQNFKKSLQLIQYSYSYDDTLFFGLKLTQLPEVFFFQKNH